MDRQALDEALADRYDADETVRRAVTRQARDLADSGQITEDLGYRLAIEHVLSNVDDAPDDHTLAERWNWWLGSLDISHGGYERFWVRPDVAEADRTE
ncbi:hypothetical protein BRC91_03600 [Halobacteriales archaeon QS_4_62_28]|nr:MAG: hypothetical protein BRC91_03600 [Halobacteriales archaeon QS_4_62_28]